ncbi:hypothetical protein WJX72_012556 [[Myrmecia] bisecta]|uniref:Uncharacterized protein n=1 Tax=[Myrmecia] bisecta TaxID=41462 RepID=A0AAW1QU33_9CHLO
MAACTLGLQCACSSWVPQRTRTAVLAVTTATGKNPQGFGEPSPAKTKKAKARDTVGARLGQVARTSDKVPLQDINSLPSSADDVDEVPDEVNNRMLRRILGFAGLPFATGIVLLPFFYYLKVVQHVDLPLWTVYVVQMLTLGGGLAGISWGVLSSSWDPRREGSLLGLNEARANLPILMDQLRKRG